jgi:type I restriction-modification system DNA methylase subunit
MNNRIEKIIQWKPTPSKGEVYTPNELVCQIINQIPNQIKKNKKHKILDPCMGTGTFIIENLNVLVLKMFFGKIFLN